MLNPYLIEVNGWRIKEAMPLVTPHHLVDERTYKVCSGCSEIIEETWDHRTTCSLFKRETLAAWVYNGIKDNE